MTTPTNQQTTPKPWFAKTTLASNGNGAVLLFEDRSKDGVHKRRLDENGVFKPVDADLLAAAPELLNALETLVAVVGLTPIRGNLVALQEAVNRAQDVIGKAKGEVRS